MSVPFDSQQGLIVVRAELFGPNGSAGVDGLLGLDFLRGQTLTVDFRAGHVTLA